MWHRGCFPWQPVILRLYPHGAVLSPAEEPTSYPCAARGTNHKIKDWTFFFLFKFEFPYLHIWMLPNTVVAFSYLRVSFCSDKQWNVSNRTNANVNKYKMLILPSTSTSLHWPFLFQIYDGKKKPEVLVDGWNVYFFDDLKTLVSVFFISHTCFSEFACNVF